MKASLDAAEADFAQKRNLVKQTERALAAFQGNFPEVAHELARHALGAWKRRCVLLLISVSCLQAFRRQG